MKITRLNSKGGMGATMIPSEKCECGIDSKFAISGEIYMNKEKRSVPVCPNCFKIIGFHVIKMKMINPITKIIKPTFI